MDAGLQVGTSTEDSHFNTLPTEIISQIFCQCTETFSPSLLRTASSQSKHAFRALDLCAVCTTWRSIAWIIPSLWSKIIVYTTPSNIGTLVELLTDQLSRCGTLPLDIAISSPYGADWASVRDPSALLDVLGPYASRWRSLLLNIPPVALQALPGPNTSLPLLTTLLIGDKYFDPPTSIPIHGATNIHTLIISSSYVASLDIPHVHDTLTSVTVHDCYVPECVHILHVFPSIQHATFERVGYSPDRTSSRLIRPPLPLHLPNLSSLQILDVQHIDPVNDLLSRIETPVLTHLGTESWYFPWRYTSESFVSRSPMLSSLSLRDLSNGLHKGYVEFLQIFHSITTLEIITPLNGHGISTICLDDRFLNLLRPSVADRGHTGSVSSLLPHLDTFRYLGMQSFTWPTLISAWSERSQRRDNAAFFTQWKEWDIKLTQGEPIPQETLDELAQLGKNLRVSWVSS